MSKIDLSGFTAAELSALNEEVKNQLIKTRESECRQAYDAMVEAARKVDMTPKELLRRYGPDAPAAAAPKEASAAAYRNRENPGETWTGRGRKPRWVIEWLESGKSLEDLQA